MLSLDDIKKILSELSSSYGIHGYPYILKPVEVDITPSGHVFLYQKDTFTAQMFPKSPIEGLKPGTFDTLEELIYYLSLSNFVIVDDSSSEKSVEIEKPSRWPFSWFGY